MAVEYGSFRVVLSRLLANGPIIGIRNVGKKIIVTSADGSIYFWSYESVLKDISLPNFSKVNLQFSVNGIAMDPEGEEGLVATSEGIFYANLKEQYTSLLVGGFTSPPFFTKILNAQYFITSHENGRLKLWNLETGE
jgi:WD40 repeat protein